MPASTSRSSKKIWLTLAATLVVCAAFDTDRTAAQSRQYNDLLTLFADWRAFQKPKVIDGVPDYTAASMTAQQRELPRYQARLKAIDPSGWPIPQQVDWRLVQAEMNGLDFDHRVRRPWATNPAFYVTVFPSQSDQPAREGPQAFGSVEIWTYTFPLTAERAAQMAAGIRAIPGLLEQAKKNLVGTGKDLWTFGTKSLRDQSAELARLAGRVAGAPGTLEADVVRAKAATDAFVAWLDAQAPSRTGPSGVGVENYDWYLKNVQLVPYTWRDEVAIMERELARAHASLALEEHHNARLPIQVPVASEEEYLKRFNCRRDRVHGLSHGQGNPDGSQLHGTCVARPRRPLQARPVRVLHRSELSRPRDHADARLPLVRPGPDGGGAAPRSSPPRSAAVQHLHDPHRGARHWLGRNDDARRDARCAAAFARADHVLLAQRAARALGDLKMHANEVTLEQAAQFASAHTPRGWLRLDANTVRGEQHLYLQQPAYGTSYVIGKIQIEELLAERKTQLGANFTMKRFMDEFNAAGLIPVSLLRWELTGQAP